VQRTIAHAARGALRRRNLDAALDWARFRVDTFPRTGPLVRISSMSYHPMPWVGITKGKRASGSWSRWRAIASVLDERDGVATALDLGAGTGFFTISLAERGLATIGVEQDPPAYRTALYAIERSGVANTGLVILTIGPETVELLPSADAVVFLSLWHHFVRAYGIDAATELLGAIWARTRRVLFFDTGENEMPASFRLPPMEPDARTWLTTFLGRVCEGGSVTHLGLHDAFDAEGRPAQRNLFAVSR
jgi:SAM-dependent methyltransferase